MLLVLVDMVVEKVVGIVDMVVEEVIGTVDVIVEVVGTVVVVAEEVVGVTRRVVGELTSTGIVDLVIEGELAPKVDPVVVDETCLIVVDVVVKGIVDVLELVMVGVV